MKREMHIHSVRYKIHAHTVMYTVKNEIYISTLYSATQQRKILRGLEQAIRTRGEGEERGRQAELILKDG